MSVIACQRIPGPENTSRPEGVTIYFSGDKPATGADSKTYYSETEEGGEVLWSATGEKLAVAISNKSITVEDKGLSGGGKVPQKADFRESDEGVVSEDGRTATFSISYNDEKEVPTGGKYRFHAVYPAQASFCLGNMSIWDWGINVGTRLGDTGQYPPVGTFDPQCDVMLAISKEEYTGIESGMTIDLIFERLVTHGKITLKGLPTDAVISKAIIKAPAGCTMSGVYYTNVIDKSKSEDKANLNYVILNYPAESTQEGEKKEEETKAASGRQVNSDGTFDLWFCTQPIVIPEGQNLQIILYTASGVIERTITAKAAGIKFEQNKLSTLGVNMSEQVREDFYSQILETPDGSPVESLTIPRTGGKKTFYIKTNAGSIISFDSESCTNIYSIGQNGEPVPQEDGSNLIECSIKYRPNCSVSNKLQATVPMSFSCYGENLYNSSLAVTQDCGAGEIVDGDWTADPVEIGGLRWYPVNLGFDLSHPFGKYYQYGRYAGQYAYCDDNSTLYAIPTYSEFLFAGTPDDDTFYGNQFWWYESGSPVSRLFNEEWIQDDSALAKGKGNPCPAGWRIPSSTECKALIDAASRKVKMTRESHYGANFTGKTSDGKAYIWEIWDSAGEKFLEFPIAGYINSTIEVQYQNDYREMTAVEFQALNNTSLKRYDTGSDYAYGMYWASDNYYDYPYTMQFISRGYSSDVSLEYYVYPGCGCSVRCVQDIPGAE